MLAESYFLSCFNVEKWLFPSYHDVYESHRLSTPVIYEDITVYINLHHLTNLEHCLLINLHCRHVF